MTTNFADISHHQAGVDLDAYKKAGHTRIILKATEGTGYTDPTFAARWKKAGQIGLDRVAYHFQRAEFNGADEFDHLYAVVMAAGGLTPRDRLCLDVEDTNTPSRAAAGCKEFGARAQARGVTQGLVYTGTASPTALRPLCSRPVGGSSGFPTTPPARKTQLSSCGPDGRALRFTRGSSPTAPALLASPATATTAT